MNERPKTTNSPGKTMTPKSKVKKESSEKKMAPPAPDPGSSAPDTSPKTKKKFSIDIYKGWCKCCGICAAFCPRECIRQDMEGVPFIEDPDRCTGCGWCELHCPDFAISVHERRSKKIEPTED